MHVLHRRNVIDQVIIAAVQAVQGEVPVPGFDVEDIGARAACEAEVFHVGQVNHPAGGGFQAGGRRRFRSGIERAIGGVVGVKGVIRIAADRKSVAAGGPAAVKGKVGGDLGKRGGWAVHAC